MKIVFLGGAHDIGASSTFIEIGGHRVLVDAGIRMTGADVLPDLALLPDHGGIEAILVTHAHTDHTGALPVVHRAYPHVPVYTTPGTAAIMAVLLQDALGIMQGRVTRERDLPLYAPADVDSLFSRIRPVGLGQTIRLFDGAVAATFFPAGHILGAACIGLESDTESVLVTGDYSVTPQLTVGGMVPPLTLGRQFRPDVLITESTYGNRLHANRESEMRRFVESVAQVVTAGGRVLIPAFAVGRAQEVLLILAGAMSCGEIAPFPVWVDGLVRQVCQTYTAHPYDLAPPLQRQITRHGNPFFGVTRRGAAFTAITDTAEREHLRATPTPGCIVTSSGMLSGGPSAFYAAAIATEPQSAIFLTGYQDEELPGRAILAVAEATDPAARWLPLNGEAIAVRCTVAKYGLSAHADGDQIAALIAHLDPVETVLVHGETAARHGLFDSLTLHHTRRITLPYAGDVLQYERRGGRPGRSMARATISAAETDATGPIATLTVADIAMVSQHLRETVSRQNQPGPARRWAFSAEDIAWAYLRREQYIAAGESPALPGATYAHIRRLLSDPASGFSPDTRHPALYHLAVLPVPTAGSGRPATDGRPARTERRVGGG